MNFAMEGAFKESKNCYSQLLYISFSRASSTFIMAPSFLGKSLFKKTKWKDKTCILETG